MKKVRGFTLVELMVVLVICGILLVAVSGLYLVADKVFVKTKPISDVLEEMRGAVATLEFVFSRWGAGVPCNGGKCNFDIIPCDGYPPSSPLCISCVSGDFVSGCSEVVFYASLHGTGFVKSVQGNRIDVVSCRLSGEGDQNYYYVWNGDRVANWNEIDSSPPVYGFCTDIPSIDCVNFNGMPNLTLNSTIIGTWKFNGTQTQLDCTNSTYTPQPGDVIMRVPHRIRLYVDYEDGYWLSMEAKDMATGNSTVMKLARVKDAESLKIYLTGKGVKAEITFQSQSRPQQPLVIERYFAR